MTYDPIDAGQRQRQTRAALRSHRQLETALVSAVGVLGDGETKTQMLRDLVWCRERIGHYMQSLHEQSFGGEVTK